MPVAIKRILCIDVGGTGLKAAVISPRGKYLVKRHRVRTPKHRKPRQIVKALADLVAPMGGFDHVTIGFPGVVKDGRIISAPHFGTRDWKGFDLASALRKKWGKPVKVLNDADVQGLAVIKGKGLELVCTLGTGFGTVGGTGSVDRITAVVGQLNVPIYQGGAEDATVRQAKELHNQTVLSIVATDRQVRDALADGGLGDVQGPRHLGVAEPPVRLQHLDDPPVEVVDPPVRHWALHSKPDTI